MSTGFEVFKAGLLRDAPSAALRLVPASAADVIALGELIRAPKRERKVALPPAQVTQDALRGALREPQHLVLALKTESEPAEAVGVLWCHYRPRSSGWDCYVNEIALSPAWRGRGLGSRLLRAVRARARGAGAEHINLDQMADNAAVERLYARLGFHVVGYDLTRDAPFDWLITSDAPRTLRVRSPLAVDVAAVADWLATQNLLESLDRPELSREDIVSRLSRALQPGGEAVQVGFIDDRPRAVAWYEHRTSKRGSPIVVLHALGAGAASEDGAASPGSALRYLLAVCAADWTAAAAETAYATVWGSPSSPALEELRALGFAIGRRKWRWRV